ncbi:MAG: hypothetical protein K2M87_02060 [Muribaculaceae bacterium]|nr:hypothetical protein [Muribaculaceae bacterium]
MIPYPPELLPKENYSLRLNLTRAISREGFVLVSRSVSAHDVHTLHGGTVELDPDAFDEGLAHLSLNLMGGELKEHHLRFRAKKPATDDWKGESVDINEYSSSYIDNGPDVPVYYSSADLHNQVYPFQLNFGDKEKGAFNAYKDFANDAELAKKCFGKNGINLGDKKYCVVLVHKPNKLNYWHFQLEVDLVPSPGKGYLQNPKSWREKVFNHLLNEILVSKFIVDPAIIPTITRCSYCPMQRKCNYQALGVRR